LIVYVLLCLLQIVIPLWLVRSMARRGPRHPRDLSLQVLSGGAYLLFTYLVLPWGFVPYLFRYLWPLLYAAAAVAAGSKVLHHAKVGAEPAKPRTSALVTLALLLCFGNPVMMALRGHRYLGQALNLEFPLREGISLVGHGGSDPSINYHNVHPQQRYALDISGLNWLGLRSWSLDSSRLNQYAVYGRTLYSPCDATVRSVVSDLPDQIPPASDPEHPAGNHVELEVEGVRIFLAHMQPGSILVKPGEQVKRGVPLGKVGNSGNTTEPHLHLHAVRGGTGLYDGEGIPLTFRGRFLVRNDVVLPH